MQANIQASEVILQAGLSNIATEMRVYFYNSHSLFDENSIKPIIIPGMPLPFPFPATRGAFLQMNKNQCNQLIKYLGLPAMENATTSQKRIAIGGRIGLRF
mmetsp:Transcript_14577/g.21730  ORF Transcript_14577/g.21730 Transcript_14577/m.21730 type:complete len:101 (+) Transcript_14577:383-685(+)